MSNVKIGIIEDEAITAIGLTETLKSIGYEVPEYAQSYTEGLELILTQKPDVLISDINLSGNKTGIDLILKVREFSDVPVIFLTSFTDKETIDLAREATPNAYLTKPFRKDELYSSIEIAIANQQMVDNRNDSSNQFQFIKVKDTFEKLMIKDIIFIKSDHVYLDVICTGDRKYNIRNSLADYIKDLGTDFIRIHKSYAINLSHVTKISNNSVWIDQIELPVGNTYKTAINAYFKKM